MKLYYVEHSVVVVKSFALIAKDEQHLQALLDERKSAVAAVPFTAKIQRDKKGNVVEHQLSDAWTYVPHGPKWDGTAKKD